MKFSFKIRILRRIRISNFQVMNCPLCPVHVARQNLVKHINRQHGGVAHPVGLLEARQLVQHHCGQVCTAHGLTKHSNRCVVLPVQYMVAAGVQVPADPLPIAADDALVPDDPEPHVDNIGGIMQPPLFGAPDVTMYVGDTVMLQHFLSLVTLPDPKPLTHPAHRALFCTQVERLCTRLVRDAVTQEEREDILFRLLCLPKLGLHNNIGLARQRMETCSTGDIYSLFTPLNGEQPLEEPVPPPAIPNPELTVLERRRIIKYVEAFRLKKAAAVTRGESAVAPLTDDVLTTLRNKHPQGPNNPFANLARGNIHGGFDDAEIVTLTNVVNRLSRDTSPGISGWSTELIQLCFRKENDNPFRQFLIYLANGMLAGTAPGRVLLCASRLTPLLQNNKIRPIACGEMFYRLTMRYLLKVRSVADDALLSIQLGVGSPGGVEPIIEQIYRELDSYDNTAEPNERYIYSLDFENAFNKVSRTAIAEAVSNHALHLFRLTEWAYGVQTPLVCRSGGTYVQLSSSQGVRQGDPLGPLLFSLVMRPKLQRLIQQIANSPHDITMAYLDDVNIISNNEHLLDNIIAAFDGQDGLTLNLNKTRCDTVSTVATNQEGIQVLGSANGTIHARRNFLTNKINMVEAHITRLRGLPHQISLILLRQCIQPQLKHLLRTMELTDLVPELTRLDEMVYKLMDYLRGATGPVDMIRDPIIQRIYSLPLSQGGCGLLSYVETYAPARATARAEANRQLHRMGIANLPIAGANAEPDPIPAVGANAEPDPIPAVGANAEPDPVPAVAPDPAIPPDIPPIPFAPTTQRQRCKEIFDAALTTFIASLTMDQRVVFYDNGGKCGSAWFHAIPQGKHRALTDKQVATALNIKVLQRDVRNRDACILCNQNQGLQHCEACPHSHFPIQSRHDFIRNLLADFVKAAGRVVTVEPPLLNNNNPARADLLVSGAEGMIQFGTHVDLTIKMVLAQDTMAARLAVIPDDPAAPGDEQKRVSYAQLAAALNKAVEDKNLHYANLPLPHPNVVPLVMSSGGTLHKGFHLFLKDIQPDALLRRQWLIDVSLALIRARARTYVLE